MNNFEKIKNMDIDEMAKLFCENNSLKTRRAMNNEFKLKLYWGVPADPISKQLKEQGYDISTAKAKFFDRAKEAISYLYFTGILTDSQHQKILKKCQNLVSCAVTDYLRNKLKESEAQQ